MTNIHLVLVADWELRGDGSGDMRRLQFDTLRRILSIYERYGLRASVNAEVMQQLAHLRHGQAHPELAALAQEWEAVVKDAYLRGHDVQLHVHSQWLGATYDGGRWTLPGAWSMLRHAEDDARTMIRECKQYLEDLLRTIDPDYSCVSFRAGAWSLAPSPHLLSILADEGLTFDMSIVDGLHDDNDKVQLDYRHVDEPLLPYHPVMTDARRVASTRTPIVCLPTFSFKLSRPLSVLHEVGRAGNTICRHTGLPAVWPHAANAVPADGAASEYTVWKRSIGQLATKLLFEERSIIGDLSALNWRLMKAMIDDVRRRAAASRWPVVPVILQNNAKDVGDFGPIEEFAAYVAAQRDLEVITLTDVHENLMTGVYRPVVRRRLALAS